MLAKHVDDDMPPFLMIDIVGECGDGIVRQRHKRWLNRFLWLWFLPSRTWTWHTCKYGETKGGGWLVREWSSAPKWFRRRKRTIGPKWTKLR